MTDPRPTPRRRPARAAGRSALAVYATCAALFLLVTGFLGVRVAQGQDPSLGAANPAQVAQAQPARRVLVRKVVVTRHVTVIRAGSAGSGSATAAPAPAPANAPVRSSTPVVTAASAPAPAPAPVRTATS
jgi:hypothetical protein